MNAATQQWLVMICRRVEQAQLADVIESLPEADVYLAIPYVQAAVGQSLQALAEALYRFGESKSAAEAQFEARLAMSYLKGRDAHE